MQNWGLALVLNASVLAYTQRGKQEGRLDDTVADATENSSRSTQCTERHLKKQVTYRTRKGAEKQLDYILINSKYMSCSRDTEANDMIDMGSDQGKCHGAIRDQSTGEGRLPKTTDRRKGKTNKGEEQDPRGLKKRIRGSKRDRQTVPRTREQSQT